MRNKNGNFIGKLLTASAWLLGVLLLFVAWVYPEITKAIITIALSLITVLAAIAYRNQQSLRGAMGSRSVRYGANTMVTVLLVGGILVVVNFLNYNHFYKKDLTQNKVHSLSEQTIKLLKELKNEVKVTVFVKPQGKAQMQSLLSNYGYYSPKLKVEYVDPDRDPARARAAGIKKYDTLVLATGKKDTKVEDVTEEKFTNALIKLLKEKSQTVCFLTGHGERTPEGREQDGYSAVKEEMGRSSWEVKTFTLLEEAKVPAACDVVLVIGPTKAFFDKELTILREWLDNGGHALFALDPDVRSASDNNKVMNDFLAEWYVRVQHNIIVDPLSRLLGVQASVPVVATYSKEHVITKDFQATTLFPLASAVELVKGVPSTIKQQWLAKSTPKSFAETNFKDIAGGQAKFDPGQDTQGPVDMLVAIEGKKQNSKATRDTRLIVMGTSQMANNMYARHGENMDLFMNSVSWLANDESLISIRPKEEGSQAITLTQEEGRYIQLITMILVPLFTFGTGVVVFLRRRKL